VAATEYAFIRGRYWLHISARLQTDCEADSLLLQCMHKMLETALNWTKTLPSTSHLFYKSTINTKCIYTLSVPVTYFEYLKVRRPNIRVPIALIYTRVFITTWWHVYEVIPYENQIYNISFSCPVGVSWVNTFTITLQVESRITPRS
jgi:hypothetical protein